MRIADKTNGQQNVMHGKLNIETNNTMSLNTGAPKLFIMLFNCKSEITNKNMYISAHEAFL